MRIMKTAKIPKGTKNALRKPSWCHSGPIRIAKIANVMIIRKTGKLVNFKKKKRNIRPTLRKTA